VGALRLRLLTALAPHVRDVVIAGQDRDYIALLAIPEDHAAIREPAVRAALAEALVRFGAGAGSAARPLRLGFLTAPLSVDTGELTDKGSISQRTILRRHAALVDRLYQEPVPDDVICVRQRVVQTA
jgi:feruloyl-CoA synthase